MLFHSLELSLVSLHFSVSIIYIIITLNIGEAERISLSFNGIEAFTGGFRKTLSPCPFCFSLSWKEYGSGNVIL